MVCVALAAFSSAIVVLGFGWEPREMLLGAGAGVLIWGAIEFLSVVREKVPGRHQVAEVPAGVEIEPAFQPRKLWLVLVVPACVGLAWLVDRWDLGAVFVPGQFLGAAAANLLGVLLVARWEHRHGRRVLSHGDGEDVELFAG
jgi:hypothetical protein